MKIDKINIEKLLRKTSKSDEVAFKELFDFYYPRLLNYAFIIVKNHESAEDIVLEVLHSIWQKRSNLKKVNNFSNYLYVSTRNKTLDYHRKNSRLADISFDEPKYEEYITHQTPESHLLNKELFDIIDQAILSLPEKTRLVYRLVKEEGMKYQEAADVLDISPKTVNNQILSAMTVIRQAATMYLDKDKKKPVFRTLISFLLF